jgi:hypothetical protein
MVLNGTNKRLRYFDGQFLQDTDFSDEQRYHLDRHRRLNRLLQVSGIAEGLEWQAPEIRPGATAAAGLNVTISAGTAIDAEGRQIVLLTDRSSVSLTTIEDGVQILYIQYDEVESESDQQEGTATRIEEIPKLGFVAAGQLKSGEQIALAQIELKDGKIHRAIDFSVRQYSGLRVNGKVGIGTTNPAQTLDVQGRIHLSHGVIQRGGDPISSTSDLGLYSQVPGHFMRFVTNNAPFKFYTDADNNPVGNSAQLTLDANGNLDVQGAITGHQQLHISGSLSITGKGGRNYFKDSEKSDGAGLRVGAAWGMYGIYAETGRGVVGGVDGVSLQANSVVITSEGNVGIGIPSPSQKLSVAGDVNITGNISSNTLSVAGNTTVAGPLSVGQTTQQMINLWGTQFGIGIQDGTQYFRTGGHFAWYRGGSHENSILNPGNGGIAQMVIANDNVGIGTTHPTQKLSVVGNTDISGNTTIGGLARADGGFQVDGKQVIDADGGWHRSYGDTGWYNETHQGGWYMTDATWLRACNNKSVYTARVIQADGGFQVGNSFEITSAGKVGIRTTNPQIDLAIGDNDTGLKQDKDGELSIFTNNQERLRINSAGNVGIGTSNPGAKLEVSGDIKAQSLSVTGNTIVAGVLSFGQTTQQMINLWGTQFGIGIQNDTQYFRTGGHFAWYRGGSHENGALNAGGNEGIAQMVIADDNVGIGTTTPQAKLDVRGSIHAGNSDIYFTKTDHKHSSFGNQQGYAAIENAEDYDALMILGRSGTDKGRCVKLWDHLEINGKLQMNYGDDNDCEIYVQNDGLYLKLKKGYKTNLRNRICKWDGDNNWDYPSDLQFKIDIENELNILERLEKLDVKNYRWKDRPDTKTKKIGFIAQDVQSLFPSLVGEMKDPESGELSLTLKYSEFGVLAIGGIKELKREKDAEIAEIKAEMIAELKKLKAEMQRLKS